MLHEICCKKHLKHVSWNKNMSLNIFSTYFYLNLYVQINEIVHKKHLLLFYPSCICNVCHCVIVVIKNTCIQNAFTEK